MYFGPPNTFASGARGLAERELGDRMADAPLDALGAERDLVVALALPPLRGAVRVADRHPHDRDRRVDAADRDDARDPAAGAHDHLAADLLAEDPVRRADVAAALRRDGRAPSGRARARGSPRPPRRRPAFLVARRLSSERSKRRSSSSRPITFGVEDAQGLLEQLLPGLGRPRGRRSWCRLASAGQCRQAWGGLGKDARRRSATTTRGGAGSPIRRQIERIERLAIPPAWHDVWISPSPRAKLQATGYDKAGRKQYLYHPDYRAAQEQAKYDKLIRFAEKLPELRATMAEHLDKDGLDRERVSAIALRLINLGWFRVGSERYARESRTYGITTLTKRHVTVRGHRIALAFRGKHKIQVRTTLVDEELAAAMTRALLAAKGARVFQYEWEGDRLQPDEQAPERLREALSRAGVHGEGLPDLGRHVDSRRSRSPSERPRRLPGDEDRREALGRRRDAAVAAELGNTPAVCRASYVSPAVVDQYLEGRTIEDFRPRHLRVVGARDTGLDAEEQALLSLLRSWRIRQARAAA